MEYTIRQVATDENALKQILTLLNCTFPTASKFTLPYLKWQYTDNPLGEIVGFNAFFDDTLAAHYVAMPIEMNLFGRKRKGLLSLNTATHPDHRGKKLFSILADKTYSYAADNGFEYVIGVANANSTHGFLKNLGFYLISPLIVKVGTGRNIYDSAGKACCRIWNEDVLKWRLNNPSATYYSSKNIIYGKRGCPGIKLIMGHIENNIRTSNPPVTRPANLYIGLGADFNHGHYYPLPKFVKHSPFNLIFKDLTGGSIPVIKPEDILFQLIDFDVA